MWPFSAKTAGDLSLNYNEIAGYTLQWLPCSDRALALAFPHLTVKAEQIPAYHYGQMEDGFALYGDDTGPPALCVAADGKTGYAFSITAHNSQALCLGHYRVGETRLGDFRDDQLAEAAFWVDGSRIVVMGGLSDCGALCGARFIFEPTADQTGDLTKATADAWRNCVMSEARFLISGRRFRPAETVNDADAVKLMKKQKIHAPAPLSPGPNLGGGDPVALLIRSQYNPTKARNSYVKLADMAVYNADPEAVKTNIKAIFTGDDDPEGVAQSIAQMFNDDWRTVFWFTLDWKADIGDLTAQIKTALGGQDGEVVLPDLAEFPANGSVGTPGVFQVFANSLQAAGLDLWFVDNPSDTHFLFIAKTSDRKRIAKLFEPTQVKASPFDAK